ncbi:hypothetical protein [Streptomyces sp. NPDC058953]|uniref:hypothetical protein n=1 Tax=unclassified Streptomyces TaxID=2593676 RepID=UPI00369D0DBD
MLKSRTAGALAAVTAAVGLTLAAAPQASASTGQWGNFPLTAQCGPQTLHPTSPSIQFQTCVDVGVGNQLRPIVVVKNNAPHAIRVRASTHSTWSGLEHCADRFVSSGQRAVCSGTIGPAASGPNTAQGGLDVYNSGTWVPGTADPVTLTF